MISHTDYIKDKTDEQLKHLIEVATARLKEIKSAGKVKLFGVFCSRVNSKWFTNSQAAKDHFIEIAKDEVNSRFPEISMENRIVPVEELADYLGEAEAKAFLATNPEIIKPE